MTTTSIITNGTVNGINLDALNQSKNMIKEDPSKAMTTFQVKTTWLGQTISETKIESYKIGGEEIKREFAFRVDEPFELCGSNTNPNPQEYLMGALNACMIVGYVAACALNGIKLEKLAIETQGEIDLRGFFALDQTVIPGYDHLNYTVHIKGDGTAEQFEKIHQFVKETSPNYYNVAKAITLNSKLVVE